MARKVIPALFGLMLLLSATASSQTEAEITVETAVCTGVEDRMPVGEADIFPAEVGAVYLWSRIIGFEGDTMIKHVWFCRGEEMAEVQLPVRGTAWRTYSYKTILPEWTGDWVVKIIDASGEVLKAVPFKVGEEKKTPIVEETPEVEETPAAETLEIEEAPAAETPDEPADSTEPGN
jgi:hypothetical protein